METYPQQLINVAVPRMNGWEEYAAIREAIAKAERDLGEDGRVLVRASGTEPKIRVMVEAARAEQVEHWATHIAGVIAEEMR